MGCIPRPTFSSDSASNSHPDPGSPSRRLSTLTSPWIEYWAEELQSPRSSRASNERYENWGKQRAAYHGGESPEPGQAAEMTPATPVTTSATARPAGPLPGEEVPERPGCSGLWRPRPRAVPLPPPAAAMTTPATLTRQRACNAVAPGPAESLDDNQDRRRHPWMPGLRPKWPSD